MRPNLGRFCRTVFCAVSGAAGQDQIPLSCSEVFFLRRMAWWYVKIRAVGIDLVFEYPVSCKDRLDFQ